MSGVRRITTRQLAQCEWDSGLARKNTNPLDRQSGDFFSSQSLIRTPPDPKLFSDLASENSQLLASLASILKKLVHTP
jgi:hypothetical protein